ncbi:hypothetical protein ACFFX0_04510 [Citricoccus parietis]|uniref:Uncharacterized protein n=1 Tax=Citricoccus parietis TaxID=592307 RepID=A0ABV5FUY1_9MICC
MAEHAADGAVRRQYSVFRAVHCGEPVHQGAAGVGGADHGAVGQGPGGGRSQDGRGVAVLDAGQSGLVHDGLRLAGGGHEHRERARGPAPDIRHGGGVEQADGRMHELGGGQAWDPQPELGTADGLGGTGPEEVADHHQDDDQRDVGRPPLRQGHHHHPDHQGQHDEASGPARGDGPLVLVPRGRPHG